MADIAKMPHLLIAGSTGSGKSVCINTLIISILYKAKPDEVKLIMIDPKVVELSVYNGIPHLFIPVVTDPKKAAGALNWAVNEMSNRYNTFAEYGVRNLEEFNRKIEKMKFPEGEQRPEKMCQIVIIVDELADLMMLHQGMWRTLFVVWPSWPVLQASIWLLLPRDRLSMLLPVLLSEHAVTYCLCCHFRCGLQNHSGYERRREASW